MDIKELIRDLVNFSRTDKSNISKKLVVGYIENDEAIALFLKTGFRLEGYTRTIDTSAIRHTLKNHSGRREVLRGQLPVQESDFVLIPLIVKQGSVVPDGLDKIGNSILVYSAIIGDLFFYYIEEVRTGKRELALKSIRKRKPAL